MDIATMRLELFGIEGTVFGSIKSTTVIEEIFTKLKKSIAFQIIIDTSGSMKPHFRNMRKSLMEFLQFIESGIELLPPDVKIYMNIVHFNTKTVQVFPVVPVEGYGEIVEGTYDQINKSFPQHCEGYTYMRNALDFCHHKVWKHVPKDATAFTMLLTDGNPNDENVRKIASNSAYLSYQEKCKKDISDVYSKHIDLTVGIGSSLNYDFGFLKKLSMQEPTIAVQTVEIVDAIRQSFLDLSTTYIPYNTLLTLRKSEVMSPTSNDFKWNETENSYQLKLGNICFAFQTIFKFKLKSPTETIKCELKYCLEGIETTLTLTTPIKPAEPCHVNMYNMLNIKEKISKIDDKVSADSSKLTTWLEELKKLEGEINVHVNDMSLPEDVRLEWKELINQIRRKQDFMQQDDMNTYAIYSSTRTTSRNTSSMRTLSSAPLRNVTQAIAKKRYQCSICVDAVEKPILYKCGHMFCMGCALGYYVSEGKTCPKCREPDMANLANIKLPIFPKEHGAKDGSLMKCLTKDCGNRYHGYNFPCMHVTSCLPCGKSLKGTKCTYEGCDVTVQEFRYYYTDYS